MLIFHSEIELHGDVGLVCGKAEQVMFLVLILVGFVGWLVVVLFVCFYALK